MLRRLILILVIGFVVIALGAVAYIKTAGLAADRKPNGVESFVARHLVQFAIPSHLAAATSPVSGDPEAWREGADHFPAPHSNRSRSSRPQPLR